MIHDDTDDESVVFVYHKNRHGTIVARGTIPLLEEPTPPKRKRKIKVPLEWEDDDPNYSYRMLLRPPKVVRSSFLPTTSTSSSSCRSERGCQCVICLEMIEVLEDAWDIMNEVCSHSRQFHEKCLLKWKETTQTCPICRASL